jgi:N-acetylglucosaminyldiphosphoundecaprenol N-acetyl-beta-D-mannosaminyltransferase
MKETLDLIEQSIESDKQIHHVVVNAGKIVQMQEDFQLRESVNGSDLINADGQAVVWAARFLN